jgi:hypothetical protein
MEAFIGRKLDLESFEFYRIDDMRYEDQVVGSPQDVAAWIDKGTRSSEGPMMVGGHSCTMMCAMPSPLTVDVYSVEGR